MTKNDNFACLNNISQNSITQLFARRKRESNTVSPGGEDHKKQAANEPYTNWSNVQDLLSLMAWCGIKAPQNILVPQSHSAKHKYRQNCMNQINESYLVLAQIRQPRTRSIRVVKHKQALGGCQPVVDLSVHSLDAVGEGREKAREAEEKEEDQGHGACGGIARAVAGEDWDEELESKEGACGEEVG